jgi:1,4-alpha-glucan branching enzyme
MGGEFGQPTEWYHETSLDWHVLDDPDHAGVSRLVARLNEIYRSYRSMYALDAEHGGFEWIDCHDADNSVLCLLRRSEDERDEIVVACNFTPVPRDDYLIGVPHAGTYRVLMNTDDPVFGGSGYLETTEFQTGTEEWQGRPQSIAVSLPPLAAVFLRLDS